MRLRGLISVLIGVILLPVVSPPGAAAGVITRSGSVLTFTDQSSVSDGVSVIRDTNNNDIRFTVNAGPAPTTTAAGCNAPVGSVVTCPGLGASVTRIVVDSAAGNDQIDFSNLGFSILGEANLGPGDDVAVVVDQDTPFKVLLHGNDGIDSLFGGILDDTLDGGADGDILTGMQGPDNFLGGSGVDVARYNAVSDPTRTGSVTVSLDDLANDGNPDTVEGDNVHSDVENVDGTEQSDNLTGSAASNSLSGFGGNDQITGGDGFDVLSGGNGDDNMGAVDNGIDQVLCGADTDTAAVDPTDVTSDCETVNVTQPPPTDPGPPDPGPPAADTQPPDTLVTKSPKRKVHKRKAKVEFGSSETGSTFACKLDNKAFTPCASPFTAKVGLGKHKLLIQATDAAGNVDSTPAVVKWKRVEA